MNAFHKASRRLESDLQPRLTAEQLRRWMTHFAESIRESETLLTNLDAAIGDGDHGVNMRRGTDAVMEKLDTLTLVELSGLMRIISTAFMTSVGGAAGPLYGAFFLQCSHAMHHKGDLGLADLTAAMEAGYRGVVQLGKAAVGDKTMVDTLAAVVSSLRSSCNHHEPLLDALRAGAKAGRQAAEDTTEMIAKKGRASYLGERSVGTQDPGATSVALLFDALAQAASSSSSRSKSSSQRLLLL